MIFLKLISLLFQYIIRPYTITTGSMCAGICSGTNEKTRKLPGYFMILSYCAASSFFSTEPASTGSSITSMAIHPVKHAHGTAAIPI